jgi:uncharacterized protein YbaP (TraB family)
MHMNRFLTLAARWSTRGLYALLFWLPAFAAHAQNGSTPVIWEARSATNTVYLFGTIHVGARKMYPLSPAVEKAFATSSVLALEADPTDPSSAMDGMANAAYQPPDNIARHISPELMAKLAKQQGKRIVELESLADQLALLQSFSPALQAGMLEQSVDSVQSGALMNELRELVAAWRTGDPDGLMGQLKKDTEDLPPELAKEYARLLYQDRNEGMATKVIAMLEGSEPTFVAVGAGHLLGPTGLVELLQAKGYKLRRL